MNKKLLIYIFFLVSLFFVTCAKQPSKLDSQKTPLTETTPLTIWWTKGFYPEEDEAIQQIVSNWEKKNGYPAQLILLQDDKNLEMALESVAAGNPPDIVYNRRVEFAMSPRLAWEGKLADVSDVIEPVKSLYSQAALASVYLNNNVTKKRSYYAVPIQQQALHIHYWQDLLKEINLKASDIPNEWDEFWQFWQNAQDIIPHKNQSQIYGIGLAMSAASNDTFYEFEQILAAYDINLLDKNGKLLVNEPKVRQGIIRALNWIINLYKDGYIPPDAVKWLPVDNNVNFLNRNLLMVVNPTLSIPASQKEDREIYHNQIKTIKIPNDPDGEPPEYLVSIKQILTFVSSPNLQKAKNFLSFLILPENIGKYLKLSGGRYFPVMPQLLSDKFWQDKKDPHISVAVKQYQEGGNRPLNYVLNPAYSQVFSENVWGQAIERVIVDGLSTTDAANEAIAKIQKIFAQW
ncbi:MAG: carbohydrate ABC transporter substrate-binding protein [Okeania sp. SIO2D1]|uniref:ABC transporter substrate-binding protein n=1 Tax=Okeania sp. SIO2C9 TaxID=2607791 RepID=UPI0013BA3170|nr:ABC transporter substrate-binding protein [Okeania sp. SIO2C9]NEQ72482.1 carbohydrate ABC transporter substrate-binding protein [Okeania sp. SIO2C9]NES67267.1 carbohydrate ABC transporter substrate-binding protein [Okeania sp. SIO2D1]